MIPKVSRYVHAVFCDDVRMEIGNKLTFVGVYQGVIEIQTDTLPASLPKLCVAVSAHTPADDLFERLNLRVMRDDTLLVQAEAPREQLVTPLTDKSAKYCTMGIVFTLSPFIVDQDCSLRVYADTERGEMVSIGVKVTVKLVPDPTSMS